MSFEPLKYFYVEKEMRNAAHSVISAVCQLRAGNLVQPDRKIQ
jgi:hypothetical protein